jgi:hypothetical protein
LLQLPQFPLKCIQGEDLNCGNFVAAAAVAAQVFFCVQQQLRGESAEASAKVQQQAPDANVQF